MTVHPEEQIDELASIAERLEFLRRFVGLDAEGPTEPLPPYTWETVARVAIELLQGAEDLAVLLRKTEIQMQEQDTDTRGPTMEISEGRLTASQPEVVSAPVPEHTHEFANYDWWCLRSLAASGGLPSSGWQPMETAPKDGRSVLLRVGHIDASFANAVQIGRWLEKDPGARRGPRARSMWRYSRSAAPAFDFAHQPIRWMPLPSAEVGRSGGDPPEPHK